MAEFELYVKGEKIRTNAYVSAILRGVMLAIISNLHDVTISDICKISVE